MNPTPWGDVKISFTHCGLIHTKRYVGINVANIMLSWSTLSDSKFIPQKENTENSHWWIDLVKKMREYQRASRHSSQMSQIQEVAKPGCSKYLWKHQGHFTVLLNSEWQATKMGSQWLAKMILHSVWHNKPTYTNITFPIPLQSSTCRDGDYKMSEVRISKRSLINTLGLVSIIYINWLPGFVCPIASSKRSSSSPRV